MEKQKTSKKKLYITLGILIFCLTFVNAAWYFIFTGDINAYVDSIGSKKEVILPFNNMQINTTTGQDKGSSLMEFVYNKAGNFSVSIIETYADNSGGECTGGIEDCSVKYYFNDGFMNAYEIKDKQNISVPYNNNPKQISANMSCVAYSCPQTRTMKIKLTEF